MMVLSQPNIGKDADSFNALIRLFKIRSTKLSKCESKFLSYLNVFSNNGINNIDWLSQKDLAREVGCCVSTISRVTRKLESLGYLTVVRNRFQANSYKLSI